ncbi:tyrosine-type recombinase/integrase [Mucilaginibacter sp. AW1-7]|uniref:tyrosine-type recombinase/integrase n=1 Tax=Mucilaginibacter sp. AW1-7 TaxID=3349874 RepID=UPI003F73A7A5
MASVKVFPRLDKANKQGQVPLYLRLTKNRKSKYIALGVYIDPKNWNPQTGKIKPNAKNAGQINSFLATKEAEAEALALEMETNSKFISAYDIKSKMLGRSSEDFFEFIEIHRKALYKGLKIKSIDRCDSAIAKLKVYCKNEPLLFDELTVKFLENYQQYLSSERHNHVNTIHGNFKVIRKIVNYAIGEEMLPEEKNPFKKIAFKAEKTTKKYLLEDELERMEKLELDKSSKLNHHRNLYIFSAYSGGIRISDLLMMRWANFDGEHLVFKIRKTTENLSVKLPQKSLDLIMFYLALSKEKFLDKEIPPESFIFPLLNINKDETDDRAIYKAISSANAYINKSLRKLVKMAKINKQISFHSARHTWAVRAMQKGMRIEYVSKLMGHASVKQTEVYATILNTELDKAMAVFDQKPDKE